MGLTFTQQQSMLSRFLGDSNTSTDDQWPLADRQLEINRGELQFAKDSKCLLRYATGTVASQVISLPSGFFDFFSLIVNSKKFTRRREISVAEFERYPTGEYFYYWVNASGTRQINFVDSSQDNQTYKLFYYGLPTTDLSADSDESPLLDQYRDGPVHYAAYKLLIQTGQTELANYHLQQYYRIVEEADMDTRRLYKDDNEAEPDTAADIQSETDTIRSSGSFY